MRAVRSMRAAGGDVDCFLPRFATNLCTRPQREGDSVACSVFSSGNAEVFSGNGVGVCWGSGSWSQERSARAVGTVFSKNWADGRVFRSAPIIFVTSASAVGPSLGRALGICGFVRSWEASARTSTLGLVSGAKSALSGFGGTSVSLGSS